MDNERLLARLWIPTSQMECLVSGLGSWKPLIGQENIPKGGGHSPWASMTLGYGGIWAQLELCTLCQPPSQRQGSRQEEMCGVRQGFRGHHIGKVSNFRFKL